MTDDSSVLAFDDPPRTRAANAAIPEGDAPNAIAATLRAAGIDAPCSLYNEAIRLAREGHLGQAVSRLQMLLGLDPDDDDALLLLAKVQAAQGRAQEALARLDAAVAAGAVPPAGFRDYLEAAIRTDRARDEEHRVRTGARDQAEVKALRAEARHLRSETVRLETELLDLSAREQRWKFAAIATSAVGSLLILGIALLGGPATPSTAGVGAAAPSGAALAAQVPAAAPPVVASADEPSAELPAAEVPAADVPAAEAPGAVPAAAVPVAAVPVAEAPLPAPEVAAPATQAVPTGPRTHLVKGGDTLYKLAARYYGDSGQWEKIQAANKGALKGGVALSLGQELVIP